MLGAVWAAPTAPCGDRYDIAIYGGSSAGVVAAVEAARIGKSVALINPYGFLGGMTASGLSSADVGNRAVVSGLACEYFQRIGSCYGEEFAAKYEPHVAERVFVEMFRESGASLFADMRIAPTDGVSVLGNRIDAIRLTDGTVIHARMFIDATYEGDLLALAGVTHVLGREGNHRYGERLNGFQLASTAGDLTRISDIGASDQFVRDVSPYRTAGDPSSGLLPWISAEVLPNGESDSRVQAYNFRVILTDRPENQVPFEKPEGYDEASYELLLRNFEAGDDRFPGRLVSIPNQKFDWNTFGAVGTDLPAANSDYVEADHGRRVEITVAYEKYTRGYFWTLANNPRVPERIRSRLQGLGYAKDEFAENGGFPYMLYVREARRMVGDYVQTEHDCRGEKSAPEPVALASYPMDSHVVQYVVDGHGFVKREGVIFKFGRGPYGIDYRSIIPKTGECENLLVPVCLSASHVAYGSLRMEPVFMALGQVSALAAGMAIDQDLSVQNLSYLKLRKSLLEEGVALEWKDRRSR